MKRFVDLVMSLSTLILTLPLIILCLITIALVSPGNPFFIQTRIGQDGRPFRMLKMRTTALDGADPGFMRTKDDPGVFRLMRRFSIDELPQLVNVLKGDMSMVGPRALTPEEDAPIPAEYAVRRSVKPGLTGLWQVSGRDVLTFEQMLQLDARYARERGLKLDFLIMIRTLGAVVEGDEMC